MPVDGATGADRVPDCVFRAIVIGTPEYMIVKIMFIMLTPLIMFYRRQ